MAVEPIIDFEECLRDSPKFRSRLEEHESNIEELEHKLDKVLKNCGLMIDAGKGYVAQQNSFTNSLWDLSTYFREDSDVMVCLNKLIHALQEINKFHSILLDQASRTVLKNITSFIKGDIKNVKESRHFFEKISTELDYVLTRNSQTSRNRPQEAEEMKDILSATRSCFQHTALDYVHCISLLQAKKRHEVLSTFLSYMHACSTYFHQGSDLCQDLDPFLKKLADEVGSMQKQTQTLEKEMENRHVHVTNQDRLLPAPGQPVEGYLFKRTSNAFKTWNRRWFVLKDNQLVYRKRTGEESMTVMEDDLRLCSVKPVVDSDRRYCFEVISPSKSHILQADSEEMYQNWIAAMQHGIGAAFQLSASGTNTEIIGKETSVGTSSECSSATYKQKSRVWEQLLKIPGNDLCCDCSSPNPQWASINLGITLCIECSGVHRSLGVHYSKVRSLMLDAWEPEILKVMAELGNSIVNRIYEANIPSEVIRATPKCSDSIREIWIKAKYVEKKFVQQLTADHRSSRLNNLSERKWSVRKLRRRPRSRDKNFLQLSAVDENLRREETVPNLVSHTDDNEPSSSNAPVNAEVLVFGTSLDNQMLVNPIELDSDQDSTGGEEEYIGEEDMSKLHPNLLLYKASAAHNLPVMCKALAIGGDKLWCNPEDYERTPLHQTVLSGSVMACEYLLLNGAKINSQDNTGKTPLHLATESGHTAQVCLLLKHKADQHIEDNNGNDPLAIAIREANADIVTLLRLGLLDEQMKASDAGSTGDDTFNDVVRDFSQLAYSHPEKLQRDRPGEDV